MNHMSRIAIILGVCLTLSACVVYAPTYVDDNQKTVVHYESTSSLNTRLEQKTTEVSKRVDPKVKHHLSQRTLADCDTFALPRDALKPMYLTDADLAAATDLATSDRIISTKMKELQTHIDGIYSKFEQAHQRWMETCAKKLLR